MTLCLYWNDIAFSIWITRFSLAYSKMASSSWQLLAVQLGTNSLGMSQLFPLQNLWKQGQATNIKVNLQWHWMTYLPVNPEPGHGLKDCAQIGVLSLQWFSLGALAFLRQPSCQNAKLFPVKSNEKGTYCRAFTWVCDNANFLSTSKAAWFPCRALCWWWSC